MGAGFAHGASGKSTPVLFDIVTPSRITSSAFAFIDVLSEMSGENECLFSIPTVFRIVKITEQINGIWRVSLELTNDDDPQLNRLTDCFRDGIPGFAATGMERLALLLARMGRFTEGQYLLKKLRESIIDDREPTVMHTDHLVRKNIENLQKQKMSLEFSKRVLEHCLLKLPADALLTAHAYKTVACILLNDRIDLDLALDYFQRAIEIELKQTCPNQESIAQLHIEMGLVYEKQTIRSEALGSYKKALQICDSYLPPIHPQRANVHSYMGEFYLKAHEYSDALLHLDESLQIYQRSHVPNDHKIGIKHLHLSVVYQSLGNYDQAVTHARRATDIFSAGNHPSHIQSLQRYLNLILSIQRTFEE